MTAGGPRPGACRLAVRDRTLDLDPRLCRRARAVRGAGRRAAGRAPGTRRRPWPSHPMMRIPPPGVAEPDDHRGWRSDALGTGVGDPRSSTACSRPPPASPRWRMRRSASVTGLRAIRRARAGRRRTCGSATGSTSGSGPRAVLAGKRLLQSVDRFPVGRRSGQPARRGPLARVERRRAGADALASAGARPMAWPSSRRRTPRRDARWLASARCSTSASRCSTASAIAIRIARRCCATASRPGSSAARFLGVAPRRP